MVSNRGGRRQSSALVLTKQHYDNNGPTAAAAAQIQPQRPEKEQMIFDCNNNKLTVPCVCDRENTGLSIYKGCIKRLEIILPKLTVFHFVISFGHSGCCSISVRLMLQNLVSILLTGLCQ
jgi:hypothetical protein